MAEQKPTPAPGPAQAGQAKSQQESAGTQSPQSAQQGGPDHQLVSMGLVDQQTLQKAQALGLGGGFLLNLIKKYLPQILGEVLGQIEGSGTPSAGKK